LSYWHKFFLFSPPSRLQNEQFSLIQAFNWLFTFWTRK
jgi:hypothetical protein